MISSRADILEEVIRRRIYDVFFYVWFSSTPYGAGEMENLVRDHNGRLIAYLEVYFPDKMNKREKESGAEEKIRQKIQSAIGQPLKQRILSKQDEDISQFYDRLREKFEPKLKQIDENLEFDSLISHGMKFHLKITAL